MTPKQKRAVLATVPENGNRIRAACLALGIRQSDLARLADVRQTLVCDVRAGRRFPKIPNARRLADALGLTMDELFPPASKRRAA